MLAEATAELEAREGEPAGLEVGQVVDEGVLEVHGEAHRR